MVICGQTIFAHALEAALAMPKAVVPFEESASEVIRLHPHLPDIVQRIADLHPTVVLLEYSEARSDLVLALLNRGIPLVELDIENGCGMLLTGRTVALSRPGDLRRLIAQIAIAAAQN
jgi:hypothetical protein